VPGNPGNAAENRTFQKILFEVRQDVEAGATLADALRKHPKAFDDLYCNMVAARETGGILDTILQRLSQYIEKIVKLRAAVRSAMVYPAAVITIAVGVVWLILWKVIPTFAVLFEGLGAQLPLPTRITIAASNFIGYWWWAVFLAIGLGVFALNRYYKTYQGRRNIDRLMLKFPVLATFSARSRWPASAARWARWSPRGFRSWRAWRSPRKTSGNAVVEDAIMATRKSIEEGKTIAEP